MEHLVDSTKACHSCLVGFFFGWKSSMSCSTLVQSESVTQCLLVQNCVDGIGAYTCTCDDNFVLNDTDLVTCHPNNECSSDEKANCDNGNARSTCAKVGVWSSTDENLRANMDSFTSIDDMKLQLFFECLSAYLSTQNMCIIEWV